MTQENDAKGYGYRARIGYTSPPLTSEIFPYEFYKLAPDGVTLLLTSLDVWEHSGTELEDSYTRTLRAAKAMARPRRALSSSVAGPYWAPGAPIEWGTSSKPRKRRRAFP